MRNGSFAVQVDVAPGNGEVLLEATDAAGNVTQRTRAFQYMPDEPAVLRFDDGIPQLAPRAFRHRRDVISLTGSTDPGCKLLLRTAAGQALARRPMPAKTAASR